MRFSSIKLKAFSGQIDRSAVFVTSDRMLEYLLSHVFAWVYLFRALRHLPCTRRERLADGNSTSFNLLKASKVMKMEITRVASAVLIDEQCYARDGVLESLSAELADNERVLDGTAGSSAAAIIFFR